jgi:hypothetical protein
MGGRFGATTGLPGWTQENGILAVGREADGQLERQVREFSLGAGRHRGSHHSGEAVVSAE